LRWGLKCTCSPHWELFNDVSQVTYTQGNWGEPQLLMVKRQIGNLAPCLCFGHNLCLKCPNWSCEPILNIYVPRDFQWCKELFNLINFDPYNRFLKIWESIGFNSQNESSLGNVRVHSLTFSYTPGSMRCDSWASFLARIVASPCLGRKPKARVATNKRWVIHNLNQQKVGNPWLFEDFSFEKKGNPHLTPKII